MTTTTHDTTIQEAGTGLDLGKRAPAASVVGIIGIIVCLVLMFSGGEAMKIQMMGSYMFGFIFWMGITLGFFGLSLLHNTVRGNWSVAIIRILEAGGGAVSFGAMFVLFLPIVANLKAMYAWADPAKVAADRILKFKAPYLNPTFFEIRLVGYFVLWAGLAWFLRKSAMRQEVSKDFKLEAGRSSWGAVGIVMFFLTCTFAVTDWVMSLEPHWSSTMFGTWSLISACLGALSLAVLIFCVNAHRAPYKDIMRPDLTKDLGNMLFVLTMLWGYTSLSQFLIIWNGNLPETTSYYQARSSNVEPITSNFTWGAVGLICIVGQFFIPFFTLITPRTKKTAMNLAKAAGWIFCVHIVDIYQYIIPALPGGRGPSGPATPALLTDALAFVAIGGIWFFVFSSQAKKAPLLPTYDTRLQEAAQHAH